MIVTRRHVEYLGEVPIGQGRLTGMAQQERGVDGVATRQRLRGQGELARTAAPPDLKTGENRDRSAVSSHQKGA